MTWYCLRLRSYGDALAQLSRDRVTFFCPMVRVVRVRSRYLRGGARYESLLEPLFPGYCFVYNPVWSVLRRSRSVGGVVSRGRKEHREPIPIDDCEIDELRTRDHVDLGLCVGTAVTVISGPFEGLKGVVESIRGGRKIVVDIDSSFSVVVQPEIVAY